MTGQLGFWEAQEQALLEVPAPAAPKANPRALRFYQVECLEAIRSWFDGGEEREPLRRPLAVLPTGLGKSSPGPQPWPAASPRAGS